MKKYRHTLGLLLGVALCGFVWLVFLSSFSLRAETPPAASHDPFAANAISYQNARDLLRCAHGHETLRDVPILYGHVGGLRSSPEIAAQADRGEIAFGGCLWGDRDHWTVCETCGLVYDNEFSSWRDEGFANPWDLRWRLSPRLRRFPISLFTGSQNPEFRYLSVDRWFSSKGLEGERLQFWTDEPEETIVLALQKWVPASITIAAPVIAKGDRDAESWEWELDGASFKLSYLKVDGQSPESSLKVEWHRNNASAVEGADKD